MCLRTYNNNEDGFDQSTFPNKFAFSQCLVGLVAVEIARNGDEISEFDMFIFMRENCSALSPHILPWDRHYQHIIRL